MRSRFRGFLPCRVSPNANLADNVSGTSSASTFVWQTQARGISTLEGRLVEQRGQAELLSTDLTKLQDNASLERGETQARANRTLGCHRFFAFLL